MGLHFDGKAPEASEYTLIEPGTYAVTLNTEWDKTKSGDSYIKCVFKIKKDVEQDFGGRIVFDGIYKDKKTGLLNESKINAILATIPNFKTDFEDYDELIQYLNDIDMTIDVEIEKADPENPTAKDKNRIKYLSYAPLIVSENNTTENVEDDELPF